MFGHARHELARRLDQVRHKYDVFVVILGRLFLLFLSWLISDRLCVKLLRLEVHLVLVFLFLGLIVLLRLVALAVFIGDCGLLTIVLDLSFILTVLDLPLRYGVVLSRLSLICRVLRREGVVLSILRRNLSELSLLLSLNRLLLLLFLVFVIIEVVLLLRGRLLLLRLTFRVRFVVKAVLLIDLGALTVLVLVLRARLVLVVDLDLKAFVLTAAIFVLVADLIEGLVELQVIAALERLLDGLLLNLDWELEVFFFVLHLELRPGLFATEGLVSGRHAGLLGQSCVRLRFVLDLLNNFRYAVELLHHFGVELWAEFGLADVLQHVFHLADEICHLQLKGLESAKAFFRTADAVLAS